MLRYIERNPLRANLVERAADWEWSSLRWWRQPPTLPFLDSGPVPRPADWLGIVHQPQTEAELGRLRRCVRKGTPFGDDDWTLATAARLGLESSLRTPGRPPEVKKSRTKGSGLYLAGTFRDVPIWSHHLVARCGEWTFPVRLGP